MFSKKLLKTFLFSAANILLAIFMLASFYAASLNVTQTFPVANMNALRLLKPNELNYLWELNIHSAPLNKSRIRFYVDFYEHLLQVYPCLRDIYGILGYCYHYLGDDTKAIDDLKKAIMYNPLYSWNYYNLGSIYVYQSRYQEASIEFQKIQLLDPQKSLQRLFASQDVYLPLVVPGGKEAIGVLAQHLKLSYRVSFDLLELINRMAYNDRVKEVIKGMKLEIYAF